MTSAIASSSQRQRDILLSQHFVFLWKPSALDTSNCIHYKHSWIFTYFHSFQSDLLEKVCQPSLFNSHPREPLHSSSRWKTGQTSPSRVITNSLPINQPAAGTEETFTALTGWLMLKTRHVRAVLSLISSLCGQKSLKTHRLPMWLLSLKPSSITSNFVSERDFVLVLWFGVFNSENEASWLTGGVLSVSPPSKRQRGITCTILTAQEQVVGKPKAHLG